MQYYMQKELIFSAKLTLGVGRICWYNFDHNINYNYRQFFCENYAGIMGTSISQL